MQHNYHYHKCLASSPCGREGKTTTKNPQHNPSHTPPHVFDSYFSLLWTLLQKKKKKRGREKIGFRILWDVGVGFSHHV